jgi:hypothetical protein
MSQSITIQLPQSVAKWLAKTAKKTGVAAEELAARELERAKLHEEKPFMRLAGMLDGPADLSQREGFGRR